MTSVVEICNQALGLLASDKFISSLADTSTEAKNCALHYDPARRELLEDFPYNFARGVVALAALTDDPPPGWAYVYRYPSDCLQARVVSTAAGMRSDYAAYCRSWDDWTGTISGRVPWEVMHDPDTADTRRIVTDIPEAYLWYTVNVEGPNQMPSLFRDALAGKLATKLAGPLRANPGIRQNVLQIAEYAISKAQVHSMNETRTDRVPDSPSILARY